MRLLTFRAASLAVATLAFLSCAEAPTAPQIDLSDARVVTLPMSASVAYPSVLISQVYGGGGNAGAQYKNDFIELFNPGATAVNVTGWRVAYASAVGNTWAYTSLTGSIAAGGYYLVQQAAGAGTQPLLPTPDASGTAAMSATAGKVILINDNSTIGLVACPTTANVVDRVAFGVSTAAGNCVPEWGARTAATANATAAIRNNQGCAYTGVAGTDFSVAAPAPRNTASPRIAPCAGGDPGPVVASVSISLTGDTLFAGDTLTLTATPLDAAGNPVVVALTWNSSAPTVASVSSTGFVTAIAAGTTNIVASAGGKTAQAQILVASAPRAISPFSIEINELMGDPANAESASWGEWFEVHNTGSDDVNLQGWRILSGGTAQPVHIIATAVIVPAGGYAVLGRGFNPDRNGGIVLDYNYFVTSSSTIWIDNNDYLALLDPTQAIADSVSWTTLPRGVTKGLRPGVAPVSNADGAEWAYATTTFGDGDYGTPGAINAALADVPPAMSLNRITTSGRTTADTLPVGFEAQVFASLFNPANVQLTATFTWASLTPDIISVDARGVIRGVAAGTGTVRVTANDGTARNLRFIIKEFLASNAAYGDAAEFGLPVDLDASDDFLVARREFTSSWNGGRGIPNWVAYNLTGDHIVQAQERCNCFTFDPQLEQAGFARYTTADYTGAGAFAGAGIDRGHLARSFDRTVGQLDNATTFYFSNIIPQYADNNQGPWAQHENYLGNLAEAQGKELTIFAGASGTLGTVKNEGIITIPAWTWKVSVIAPLGTRLEDVQDYRDLQIIAVVMPNAPGIRNANWQTEYVVTADSVEKLSGYRFLTALPEKTRRALITGTQPPLGTVAAASGLAGAPITFSSAGSLDPNGSIVSYAWNFSDGNSGTGAAPSHTYALAGSYTVQLIVTDNDGLADTVSAPVTVARLTPAQAIAQIRAGIEALAASAGLNRGEVQSLLAKVNAAEASFERGNANTAMNQLDALFNQLQALVNSGRATTAQIQRITLAVENMI